jgi:hypothetical protein
MPLEATHGLDMSSKNAKRMTSSKNAEVNGEATLQISDDDPDKVGVIYIYNCVPGLHHAEINQPPNFPRFKVPDCKLGDKVGYTTIRALIKNRFTRPGTDETYYIHEDGRKHANSLLNPSMHPASTWDMQLVDIAPGTPGVAQDQYGNNLNAFGVWWSMTAPDDPALESEIERFKKRVMNTFKVLIASAEEKAAKNERHMITPREHFAMEYLGFQAPWHQSTSRVVPCPNCGMIVREGIAYHKNDFGEKCIIDREKYDKLFPAGPSNPSALNEEIEEETVPAASRPARKQKSLA